MGTMVPETRPGGPSALGEPRCHQHCHGDEKAVEVQLERPDAEPVGGGLGI